MMAHDGCFFLGIDQWGNSYHGLRHPRKDLVARTGYQHVAKMYRDGADGSSGHAGYVVGPFWIDLYRVYPYSTKGGPNDKG